MSRAYRIVPVSVSEVLRRDITATDEICTELELLEILPADAMAQLLRDALAKRGFEAEDGSMVRRDGGLAVIVEPDTGKVTIRLEQEKSVEVEGNKSTTVTEGLPAGKMAVVRERLRDAIRRELESRTDSMEQDARRQVSAELEARLGEISQELDEAVNEVTREALKQKAASLGEIRELHEDPQAGSLTIRVAL
jgi:uncharacterized protein involved in exopolysaccharide biosynthesis